MEDQEQGWQQFQRARIDRKLLAKRARKIETASTRHAHRFVVRRLSHVRLVRREITTWLLTVGAIIAGLGAQLLLGQANYMQAAPKPGGSYVEATIGPLNSLNPLFAASDAEASVGRLLFSSLYTYDETASLRADLITKLDVGQDGKVYTATIRSDALWHDGKPLTAKDIVYTVNLMKNPSTRYGLRINWIDVSVRETGKYDVEFTLPAAYAAFPYALTFPVLPEHLLASVSPGTLRENIFSQSPVGSGPFTFELLQQVNTVRNIRAVHMKANEHYYGGRPKLDRFELQAYQDEAAILAALNAGEVSGTADVSARQSDSVSDDRYNKTPQMLNSGVYAMFNTVAPILKDAAVRKALQLGTDTKTIRQSVGHGARMLELPFIGSQIGAYDSLPHPPAYNPEQASATLEQAGWKLSGKQRTKDGQQLALTITTTKNNEFQSVVKLLAEQWSKLGITVKTKTVDANAENSTFVQDTLQGRNFEVLVYELSIGADPDVYAYWHSSQLGQSGYNFTNYSNKTADAALASARARLEPDLRNAKYRQFAKLWLEDAPAIGLYQPTAQYISTKRSHTVSDGASLVTATDRYASVLNWTVENGFVYKTP